MERKRLTRKQVAVSLAVIVLSCMPGMIFIVLYDDSFSPRQMGVVGVINMAIFVPLVILVGRRWISKIK